MTSIYLILGVGFLIQGLLAYYTATRSFKDVWWRKRERELILEVQRAEHKLDLAEEELGQTNQALTRVCSGLLEWEAIPSQVSIPPASSERVMHLCQDPFGPHLSDATRFRLAVEQQLDHLASCEAALDSARSEVGSVRDECGILRLERDAIRAERDVYQRYQAVRCHEVMVDCDLPNHPFARCVHGRGHDGLCGAIGFGDHAGETEASVYWWPAGKPRAGDLSPDSQLPITTDAKIVFKLDYSRGRGPLPPNGTRARIKSDCHFGAGLLGVVRVTPEHMAKFSRPLSVVTPAGEWGYWPDEIECVPEPMPINTPVEYAAWFKKFAADRDSPNRSLGSS